jgi:hypothetical protein
LRVTENKQTYYTDCGTSLEVVKSKRWWVGLSFGWEKKEIPTKYWWEKLLKSGQ